MITAIDHIAIAVASLEESIPFYRDTLGLPFEGTEVVEDQKVKVAFFRAGPTRIELLEPTAPDSPISKFLETRGNGLHHLALRTDDIEHELEAVSARGVRLIDAKPRRGAHHTHIAFLHPKATGGILLELTEPQEA